MDEAELGRRVDLYFLTRVVGAVVLKRMEMDDPGSNRVPIEHGLRMLREASRAILSNEELSPGRLIDNICDQVRLSMGSNPDSTAWCELLASAISANLDQYPIDECCKTLLQFGRSQLPSPETGIVFKPLIVDYERVHSLDSPIQVTGSTYIDLGEITIILEFGDGCPSFEELCVLPYVVLHELVSHAFAHESAVQNDGSFQDGWMDLVAIQLHDSFIAELTTEPDKYSILEFPERVLEYSSMLHAARYKSSGRLRTGRDAGERLVRALKRLKLAQEVFWEISHGLNRTNLSRNRRNAIAETVASARRLSDSDLDALLVAFSWSLEGDLVTRAKIFASEVLTRTYS